MTQMMFLMSRCRQSLWQVQVQEPRKLEKKKRKRKKLKKQLLARTLYKALKNFLNFMLIPMLRFTTMNRITKAPITMPCPKVLKSFLA